MRSTLVALLPLAFAGLLRADPPPTVADGARLTEVFADDRTFEGPTFDPKSKKLYFAAAGKDGSQILRLDAPGKASVWLDKSLGVAGTFLALDGRLIGAQSHGHRVTSYALGGDTAQDPKTLYFNEKLHQPNDVCQAPDGDIYFTDPDAKERKASAVYRLGKDGQVAAVVNDMPFPNGLITSPDGKTLYVSDSHLKLWRSYPINADGGVGAGKVFFEAKTDNQAEPDGMTIDATGNLYLTGRGGVWVVKPDGTPLGLIPVAEACTHATFGGDDGQTLYVTAARKVYSLAMKVKGGR